LSGDKRWNITDTIAKEYRQPISIRDREKDPERPGVNKLEEEETELVQEVPEPPSVKQLNLTRERSRIRVNEFLESPEVNHKLGGVPGWRACFGARYKGILYAVCVVGRPTARMLDDDEIVEITRFGTRPERPQNTGSWLIAKARDWSRLEGYEKMIAYSGIADNVGTLYKACGFELDAKCEADGSSWTNREGREEWEDYTRRRYSYNLGGIVRRRNGEKVESVD
jgi:hypothetical protein